MTTFTVTKQWIEDNRTVAGAWNRKQTDCLGLEWPLRKGWKDRIAGTEITIEAKEMFEKLAREPEGFEVEGRLIKKSQRERIEKAGAIFKELLDENTYRLSECGLRDITDDIRDWIGDNQPQQLTGKYNMDNLGLNGAGGITRRMTEKEKAIKMACDEYDFRWPDSLPSGIMSYGGYKITIGEFNDWAMLK